MQTTYKFVSSSVQLPHLQKPTLLALLQKPRVYAGYMNGYRQPTGFATFQVTEFHPLQIQCLQQALEYYFGEHSMQFNLIQSEYELVKAFGESVCALQKAAGLPIFESVQIDLISEDEKQFSLWIPVLHEDCFHWPMAFMLQFFAHHLASASFVPKQDLANEVTGLMVSLKNDAPKGPNSLRLLQAAYHAGIPWCYIAQSTFQYGYGCNSRWLYSSFTDKTSHLAAGIVKDKHSTLTLLRQAGFPVPEQKIVHSESDAVENANIMGYPVVIKPHNQDGGRGVSSRIVSDIQVKKAYINASEYSETVLLEKYIPGKDYRLLLLNGELIWAIERIPAGVTGDGKSNINELIQAMNQQPDRSKNTHFILKQVEINESVIDFLTDQGLTLNSIPESGQFVPVNRIANISTGGTPVAVFDKVHLDNKRLAESVANLLRLDIAGIDFISADIEHSYLETGGAIIEINAQPDLGIITTKHIYKQILSTLLPNQGRIPIIVIVCDDYLVLLFRH